jgi:hypothetical protein
LHFVNSPNHLSDWNIVRHGFPQVSVSGPLMFNVYIDGFRCFINKVFHTVLFADDTNIFVSSSDRNELNYKIHSVLRCLSKWFQNNRMALNLNKTHIVKFASFKLLTYPLNTAYNNRALTVTEYIKFLGKHRDCNLI